MIELIEEGPKAQAGWGTYKEALKTDGLYEVGLGDDDDDVFFGMLLVVAGGVAVCFDDDEVYGGEELRSADNDHWRYRRLPKGATRTYRFTQED